jgi:protoheme IX farnesyltransferase
MLIVFLGFFFDVVVYSLWLKRRTRYSIIFGGIAGGLPAMAGRTAVLGIIDSVALLVGLFVLCWIPLHILTLALIPENLEGYEKAGVPFWPVVKGKKNTIQVITLAAVLAAVIINLTAFTLNFPLILILPLLIFSGGILTLAGINLRQPTFKTTFRLFKAASIYMAFAFLWLFIGVVITPMLT